MIVCWTAPALDDVRAIVPEPLRQGLRDRLRAVAFPGQGPRCTDPRYPGAHFVKYRTWLVMYVEVQPGSITVVGVEYDYGQPI